MVLTYVLRLSSSDDVYDGSMAEGGEVFGSGC